MIKCATYWSMPEGLANTHPIDDAFRRAKNAGFDGIELAIGPEGALNVNTSRDECEKIRAMADDLGLVLQTVGCGMTWAFSPTSDDADVRRKSIKLHDAALQRTAWLGCQAMLYIPGVVGGPINPDRVRYDLAIDRAREACKVLLETAENVGVDLCLENVWNGLMYSPLEFRDFIDSFNHRRLGVYFDVGNVLGFHQYPPHWIDLLGERIKRIHIKDYMLNFDWTGSFSFCELGEGDVPWPETMQAIRHLGYNKTIVAEILPYSDGILERTAAAMDRILQ